MARRLPVRVLTCIDVPCLKEATSRCLLQTIPWLVMMIVPITMMMPSIAMAQASSNQLIVDPPRGLELDRAGTIQRFGLSDPALKLSNAQKAQIDKVAAALAAESAGILQRHPLQQDARGMNQEGMAALTQARNRFTDAVNNVLNQEQKRTWEAKRPARRLASERGPSSSTPIRERVRPLQ